MSLAGPVQALPALLIDQPLTPSICYDCRTTSGIVWSCLVTVFSCTWIAIHPNIPAPDRTWIWKMLRRAEIMIVAVIAPEFVITWAAQQWFLSRRIAQRYPREFSPTHTSFRLLANLVAPVEHRWTQTHGFFALMGGFMIHKPNEPGRTLIPELPQARMLHPSVPDALAGYTLDAIDDKDFPDITEDEIEDRSKGDILSKGLVIIQTAWFVVQCISRAIQHLPLTELEISTLAFAVLNFATYAFWWNKPLNVEYPYVIGKREGRSDVAETSSSPRDKPIKHTVCTKIVQIIDTVRFGYHSDDKWENAVPTFYAGEVSAITKNQVVYWALYTYFNVLVCLLFGGIHCIAWSFHFPSHAEQMLWRSACVVIMSLPLFISGVFVVVHGFVDLRPWVTAALNSVLACMAFLYVVARLVLIALAFTSLRSLPPGAYEFVSWTTYIPHVTL